MTANNVKNENMDNLPKFEPESPIDWSNTDEGRKNFQKLTDDSDNLLENLRGCMNDSLDFKESKASFRRLHKDLERSLVGGQDISDLCKERQLVLKRSSENTQKNTVQKYETETEDVNHNEKDLQNRHEDEDNGWAQRVKCGHLPMSERKKDPESSKFLLKWPLSLKPVPEKTHNEDTETFEDDAQKNVSSPLTAPKFSFRRWTNSEIKTDPEFSKYLLKWPPEDSTIKLAPKTSARSNEGPENCKEDIQKKMSSPPGGPKFSFRKRSDSEIKTDPEFSKYLLKWPPE